MTQEEVNLLILFVVMGIIWSIVKSKIDGMASKYSDPSRSVLPPAVLANRQVDELRADDTRGRSSALAGAPADVVRDLELIRRLDPTFEVEQFLDSARLVYEAVVLAFAKGDRGLLRELTSDEVYGAFLEVIEQREHRGERTELDFVSCENPKISNTLLFNTQVQITVSFAAQLVTDTRDAYGAVIDGDPNKVLDVSELWTFACEFSSRKPAWKLIATDTA